MLVALAAEVGDTLAAKEGEVALHSSGYGAFGEGAIRLVLLLAVENVSAEVVRRKLAGDGRQILVGDGSDHGVAVWAVKSLSHANVIDVVILDACRDQLSDNFRKRDGASEGGNGGFMDNGAVHGLFGEEERWRLKIMKEPFQN